MDNGYEIAVPDGEITERRDISLFLGDDQKTLRAGGGELYDATREFEKTRFYRNHLVLASLVAVVLVTSIAAWLITTEINRRMTKVDIDIQSFQDLNLRDILDSAKRFNDELDRSVRDLASLEMDRDARLERIRDKKRADILLLEATALSAEDAARRRRAIDAEAASAERLVMETYEPDIRDKRIEIAAIQEKIASYDTRSMETARKQQEVFDNQQRVYELEKERLASSYEQRIASLEETLRQEQVNGRRELEKAVANFVRLYNPLWPSHDPVGSILSAAPPEVPVPPVALPSVAPTGSAVGTDRVNRFSKAHAEASLILSRLGEVPYTNSVPAALRYSSGALAVLGAEYTGLLSASSRLIEERNRRIADLENRVEESSRHLEAAVTALTVYVRNINVAGIVIESSSTPEAALFIDPLFMDDAINGRPAWIFRGDDELVAEVELFRRGKTVWCRIGSLREGYSVRPFDRVLLKLTGTREVGR